MWDDPPTRGNAPTVAEVVARQARVPQKGIAHKNWASVPWLPGKPGQSILDIGCGAGAYHDMFDQLKGMTYTGCDISDTMVRIARERHPAGRFELADATALPYGDGEFDMAFCCAVLLHLPQELEKTVIREAIRVARRAAVVQVFALEAPPRQEWWGWCGYLVRHETLATEQALMRQIDPTVEMYTANRKQLSKRMPPGTYESWPGGEFWFVFRNGRGL